jgi:hypothetical protein
MRPRTTHRTAVIRSTIGDLWGDQRRSRPSGHDRADTTEDASSPLDTITVVATGVSNMGAASAGDVSQEQLAIQPLLRPAALLENVPGLIVSPCSHHPSAI